MKRKIVALVFSMLFLVYGIMGDGVKVEAAGDYTSPELTLTRVEDITPYNDYIENDLNINNTLTYNNDGGQVYKFTIEKDGFVKLLLTCREVKKLIQKYGKTSSTSSTDASLSATIYRDSGLLYPVSTPVSAKAKEKGETKQNIALDKGTYYIGIQTDKYVNETNNGTTTITSVLGNAELIVYYQVVDDDEIYRPSIIGTENEITMEKEFVGLLTATNPKDYYKFRLTDKALVKINFMYNSKNSAKFILYGTDEREELISQTVSGNNIWYNAEKYLEPGTYYCSLETVTANDGGVTRLLLNQTVYPLNLRQVNQAVNSHVLVSTIDDPEEIRYVLGKLTNSELKSAKWNKGKVITDTLLFGVNKTGYYTVRVTDSYGNMFMESIRVTDCDNNAPKIPVIKSCMADTFLITGTAEKNSLVTVYVNGKAYICTASSKGSFKCNLPNKLVKESIIEVTAQDISGNISAKAEATVK